jgi:hypothetical protein
VNPDVQTIKGALASTVGTWITQRHQNHCDLLEKKLFLREQLLSDFISESTRVLMDALEHNSNNADRLIPTYTLVSRMRLSLLTGCAGERRQSDQEHCRQPMRALPCVLRKYAPGPSRARTR